MERQETFSTPVDSEITQLQKNDSEVQDDEPEAVVKVVDPTKLSYELQQGYRIFRELLSDPYRTITYPFLEPVDAEALGLWDYHERIKEPMCFTTIGSKFNNYKYKSITEVISDMRLMLENCYRYNGADHWVSKQGQKLEKVLEQKCALLNRSLREKVTLSATMAVRGNYCVEASSESISGRRRSGRNSYIGSLKGENSSLVTQMKIQEECEERERRKQREKEKKEANEALLQELTEWEENHLTDDIVKHLHSMWEIPSVGSLLYLLKDILNIQDICFSEFELSFLYPKTSSLLARIFTALLLTPHQRKSLSHKPAMKFNVWQAKLRGRLALWHKHLEKDGTELAAQQFGLDARYFDILGGKNPLEENGYDDLSCHKRVWILKSLVDSCLYLDADFRGQLNTVTAADQRELLLGFDAENWSYLYFPMLCSTDIRIYRQAPLPSPSLKKTRKGTTANIISQSPAKSVAASLLTPRHPRLRKLKNETIPSENEPSSPKSACEDNVKYNDETSIEDGFETVCYDVVTLKQLCDKFSEPPPPPKKRGRKPKPLPPRKRCEVDLHETFQAMWEELEKYESKFTKFRTKAKIKLMKECQEPHVEEETADETVKQETEKAEREDDYGSEESAEEKSDSEGEVSSDEESEPVDENSTEDTAKRPAWKRKLGIALAEAVDSPGSPAVSEDGVEHFHQRTKKYRNDTPQSTENVGDITVSVSAAEAVQALGSFPTSRSDVSPYTPPASRDIVDILTTDANGKPTENLRPEGISLRAKPRDTLQRTLVVPTASSLKSLSTSNSKLTAQPLSGANAKRLSCSNSAAESTSSKARIPAVLIQHGIVKLKKPKPKTQPVPVEPWQIKPQNLKGTPSMTSPAQKGVTTDFGNKYDVEDQMAKSNRFSAVSSNVSSATALMAKAVGTIAVPSPVVKKTVLVCSQPSDIGAVRQLPSKTGNVDASAPPMLTKTKDTTLSPAMFVIGQSAEMKQILTPKRTSTGQVLSRIVPSTGRKLVLPSSAKAQLSNTQTTVKTVSTTTVAPCNIKKPAILKKAPIKAGQIGTQLVRGPQSFGTSMSLITTGKADLPKTYTINTSKVPANVTVAPSAISNSGLPPTAVGFVPSGTVIAPALFPATLKQEPVAGRSPVTISVANTSIVSQTVSNSGNVTPAPAVKVLFSVPTAAQLQATGAHSLPSSLKTIQQLSDASHSHVSCTSYAIPQITGPRLIQPTVQVSSVPRVVSTSIPLVNDSKGSLFSTSSTAPVAYVAPKAVAQLQQHAPSPSPTPVKSITVPTSLLTNLPQQASYQKLSDGSTVCVHPPAKSSQLAHSKQYAFAKLVTTSTTNRYSNTSLLQKTATPTAPHSVVQAGSITCVPSTASSSATLTTCKQTERLTSVATQLTVPQTLTISKNVPESTSGSAIIGSISSEASSSNSATVTTVSGKVLVSSSLLVNCQVTDPSAFSSKPHVGTNECGNTASATKLPDDSVHLNRLSVLKRSLSCINGDLNHIPKKQCRSDDDKVNGTVSGALEHSSDKETFISTSSTSGSDTFTKTANAGNTETLTNASDLPNGVATDRGEKLEIVENGKFKPTESSSLKTFYNGAIVEIPREESSNH